MPWEKKKAKRRVIFLSFLINGSTLLNGSPTMIRVLAIPASETTDGGTSLERVVGLAVGPGAFLFRSEQGIGIIALLTTLHETLRPSGKVRGFTAQMSIDLYRPNVHY